jgi:4'-phosphopantetheinyl transferase
MNVYWLEQAETDVTSDNLWLSDCERLCLAAFRVPKRRADWRLGRWTAKRAVAAYLNLLSHPDLLARIEIHPTPSGAPEVFLDNHPAGVTISLSHSSSRALCAVAQSGVRLGCDLEVIEARSDSFITDYFTSEEQGLVARTSAGDKARLATLLWSSKESALKALHEGLRLDTRSVIVSLEATSPDLDGWSPLWVRHVSGQTFYGWWQHEGGMLRTLVAHPAPALPIWLEVSAHRSELRAPPPCRADATPGTVRNVDDRFHECADPGSRRERGTASCERGART